MSDLTKLMICMLSIGACFVMIIMGIEHRSIWMIVTPTIVGIFYICIAIDPYNNIKAGRP